VRAHDPEATVIIYPSDHFIFPESRFVDIAKAALEALEMQPQRAVILGAPPDSLELEYGWIKLGKPLKGPGGRALCTVEAFYEKPGASIAMRAMAAGALWNTLIIASKVDLLWKLGWRYVPEIIQPFEALVKAIGTSDEKSVLHSIYGTLPSLNFASHLLTHSASHLAVMEMKDVLWCDWGKPERIVDTLRHIGKAPSFPTELLPSYRKSTDSLSDILAIRCNTA
jgi:mannose-1-phosphate guanylyltransferase